MQIVIVYIYIYNASILCLVAHWSFFSSISMCLSKLWKLVLVGFIAILLFDNIDKMSALDNKLEQLVFDSSYGFGGVDDNAFAAFVSKAIKLSHILKYVDINASVHHSKGISVSHSNQSVTNVIWSALHSLQLNRKDEWSFTLKIKLYDEHPLLKQIRHDFDKIADNDGSFGLRKENITFTPELTN